MSSLNDILKFFDPDGPGQKDNTIFGLPFKVEDSSIVVYPVPWEVTTSYRPGTANAPEAVFEASLQVDLYDIDFGEFWRQGLSMAPLDADVAAHSHQLRQKAEQVIATLESGDTPDAALLQEVNKGCSVQKERVRQETLSLIRAGHKVVLLGGDHSTPLGYMEALHELHGPYSILQIDAHADLREAYEGFTYSHASIMWNALNAGLTDQLVQVGVRDIGKGELEIINRPGNGVLCWFNSHLNDRRFRGQTWADICEDIIGQLGDKVYISFDIDGLEPAFCPNTGTPVPGGLTFDEAVYLLKTLKASGRQIIGADLCEVSPGNDEWDANVGARMLYKLCGVLAD